LNFPENFLKLVDDLKLHKQEISLEFIDKKIIRKLFD